MSEAATGIDRPAGGAAAAPLGLGDLLRVSRAGLIVSHLWAYLLPAMHGGFEPSWNFWLAAFYVTFPLGLLIYGWNDYFDADVDRISPRKNDRATGAVFGARLGRGQLASLPLWILAAQLPFAAVWALIGEYGLLGWLALMAALNGLYNGPRPRLSRVPILAELTATSIYLLIVWLGVLVHSPGMPAWSWLFAGLSILNLQIMGTVVDLDDDARVRKRTLSVAFGRTVARAAVLVSLAVKTGLTYGFTGDLPGTLLMLAGVVLVAGNLALPGWRPSATAYSSFIVLDWLWLARMFLR